MAGSREITVKILGDATSAKRALGQLDDATGKTEGRFAKFGGAIKAAALIGGVALIKLGKDSVAAFGESQKVAAQTEAVIKSTGGAAGVTGKQIGALSSELQKLSGVEDEAIQSGANMLLTFTNIKNVAGEGGDVFNQATKTLLDMSVALGTDAKTSAVQLGKALQDPIAGISALRRVGVTFTDEQKATIRTMVEMGDTAGAQKLILAELNREFGGSAKAAGDAQTPMQRLTLRFGEIQEKIGAVLIPTLEKLTAAILGVIGFIENLNPAVLAVIGVLASLVAGVFLVIKAKEAWVAIQTALNVVMAMNPFVLVGLAIAALVAGIVIAYQQSETFRNIVDSAFRAVATAAVFMKDTVVGAFRFLVDTWLAQVEWILKGAAAAFGWVPGIGPKLKAAAREVEGFRDDVNRALGGIKDKVVNVSIGLSSDPISADIAAIVPRRAHGGPVSAGKPYIVGEERPELFVPSQSGTILPSVPGGGTTYVSNTYVTLNAGNVVAERDLIEMVATGLEERRRRNGPGNY